MDVSLHRTIMRKTLLRLKQRLGRDRARYWRLHSATSGASKERAFGEANVCGVAMGYVEEELRKLKGAGR